MQVLLGIAGLGVAAGLLWKHLRKSAPVAETPTWFYVYIPTEYQQPEEKAKAN